MQMSFSYSLTSSAPAVRNSCNFRSKRPPILNVGMVRTDRLGSMSINASSYTASTEKGDADKQEEKSDIYSNNMTEAMGAVLTYKHELGMNYNFIRPDLIVGSCLQTPSDAEKLRNIGVKTILCLQQDADLEYFGVDIGAIQRYAKECKDIDHIRAEIRDFDAFDLRMRLPVVVSILDKATKQNGGVTYIHCTAGLGRAPATALAYMFWVQEYKLSEAIKLLMSKRPCFPKLEAIKNATADILTGLSKKRVTLTWKGNNCSSVEISGLDIGWGQRIPLKFNNETRSWTLDRDLPEGRYEYKYIVNGEWTCNKSEAITGPNRDGHINNYIQVPSSSSNVNVEQLHRRLTGDDVNLTAEERQKIRDFLDTCSH